MKKQVYFGSFAGKQGENGIYYAEMLEDNVLSTHKKLFDIANPSYLAFSKNKNILYAFSEYPEGAEFFAFKIKNDDIELINSIKAEMKGACHISLSFDEKILFAASYVGGEIAAIKINEDGSLCKVFSLINHNEVFNKINNKAKHAHFIAQVPYSDYVLAVDLGADAVFVYKLSDKGLEYKSHLQFAANTGPRHLAISKESNTSNRLVYLMTEYSNELITLNFDINTATLIVADTQSSLPDNFNLKSDGSAVKISPDGKKLALSNRVVDNEGIITVFDIDQNGKLANPSFLKSGGIHPRDFCFASSNSIIVCNMLSNNVCIVDFSGEIKQSFIITRPSFVDIF